MVSILLEAAGMSMKLNSCHDEEDVDNKNTIYLPCKDVNFVIVDDLRFKFCAHFLHVFLP